LQENAELWKELCAQAAVEQDPQKLQELVRRINELLDAKTRRLAVPNEPSKFKPGQGEHSK
jgi:hypothetical protein